MLTGKNLDGLGRILFEKQETGKKTSDINGISSAVHNLDKCEHARRKQNLCRLCKKHGRTQLGFMFYI